MRAKWTVLLSFVLRTGRIFWCTSTKLNFPPGHKIILAKLDLTDEHATIYAYSLKPNIHANTKKSGSFAVDTK
jgi:hypothetical protein